MGINVAHNTSPGFAALTGYAAGKSRRQDIEQERLIRAMEIRDQRKIQREQMDEAARQFDARLNQSDQQFGQEMDYRWQQADQNRRTQFGLAGFAHQNRLTEMGYQNQYQQNNAILNNEMAIDRMGIEEGMARDRIKWNYSYQQQMEFDRNSKAIQEIQTNPEKFGLRPDEAEKAIADLERKNNNIIYTPQSALQKESPYPQGQDVGQSWREGNFLLARDGTGKIYKVGEYDNNQIALETRIKAWTAAANIAGDEATAEEVKAMYNQIMSGEFGSQVEQPTPSQGQVEQPTASQGQDEQPTASQGQDEQQQPIAPGQKSTPEETVAQNRKLAAEMMMAVANNNIQQKIAEDNAYIIQKSRETGIALTGVEARKLQGFYGQMRQESDSYELDRIMEEYESYMQTIREKLETQNQE